MEVARRAILASVVSLPALARTGFAAAAPPQDPWRGAIRSAGFIHPDLAVVFEQCRAAGLSPDRIQMIMLQSVVSEDRDSPSWPRVIFATEGRIGPIVDRLGIIP